ncbi:MAG: tRNA-dihydrouridine synthase [bacterium]
MKNFWQQLPKPFFCLAPMADVTDVAFRKIIAKYSRHGEIGGGPDVFWTEFVSSDGLMSPGREVLKHDLEYSEGERPIVAQLFGSHIEKMEGAARLCAELGFDGIDINMGCPDKSIEKQNSGAAMMKNPELARAIIRACKRGAPNLPISVKTRIGYNKNEIKTWIPELLAEDIAVLTVHARTRKEMSKVPARWEHVREVVELRNQISPNTLIVGNGDVIDIADAKKKVEETGCDGVMLGRAIFGNPWLFDQHKKELSVEEKLRVMVEHTKTFEEKLGGIKSFSIMKKHYKAYVQGFDGAKELREKLMLCENATQIEEVIHEFLAKK